MKKLICLTVAAVLLLFAAACSKNIGEEGGGSQVDPKADPYVDPYVGKWDAVSASALGLTVAAEDAFANETSLNLKDKGSCTVTIDGDSAAGEWSIIGGIVRISTERQNFTGLIDHENGFLVLELPSHGMDVNFTHQDGNLVTQPKEPVPEPPPGGWRDPDDPQEWWDGEWFGYMTVDSVIEGSEPERFTWNCFGVSDDVFDGEKYIYLWDEGMVIGTPTFVVDFGGGTGDRGKAAAYGGAILDSGVGFGDWTCDPELSRYKDQFVIDMRSELDSGGYLDYQIVLRPWGMLWDDVPEEERPPGYDDYLDLYRGTLSEAGIPSSLD